ncbi:FAD:protein FMN transferase [Kitasatospora phosalacinea]|nr:FAD:protein FMN transferase [Kitasatospora phosalacinea]
MGTVVSLSAPAGTDPDRLRTAADAAFAHLHRIDRVFSPFEPESPVSRIRDGRLDLAALPDHPDGAELHEVLALCERLRAASDGSFDAWAVGDPPRFDPSGAVKGWAAERASALAAARGLPRHVLNAGGDVRLRAGDDPRPWRVGITDPHRPGGVLAVLAVTDGAVATSGTAERGPHVTDPHTGRPATSLVQVTVTGPDLALADGYATAALARAGGPGGVPAAHAWLTGLARRTGYQSLTVDPHGSAVHTPGLADLLAGAGSEPSTARG